MTKEAKEYWKEIKFRSSMVSLKDSDFLDLVDELLLVVETVSEKLLKKIGKAIGEKWIRWGRRE